MELGRTLLTVAGIIVLVGAVAAVTGPSDKGVSDRGAYDRGRIEGSREVCHRLATIDADAATNLVREGSCERTPGPRRDPGAVND